MPTLALIDFWMNGWGPLGSTPEPCPDVVAIARPRGARLDPALIGASTRGGSRAVLAVAGIGARTSGGSGAEEVC